MGLFTFNEKASQGIKDTHRPTLQPTIHKSRKEIVSLVPLQNVLFPTNISPGAERWRRGPCLMQGPLGMVTRVGGARWGCWRRVPGPIRTRGAPGARFFFSRRSAAWRVVHRRAEPAGVSGRTGLSGLSSWVSAVRDRRASVISFLRPPGPGRGHPPGSPGSVRGRRRLSLGPRGGNAAAVAGWAAGGGSKRNPGALATGRDAALACARLPRPPLRSGARRGMRWRPRAGERPAPRPPGSQWLPVPRVPRRPR